MSQGQDETRQPPQNRHLPGRADPLSYDHAAELAARPGADPYALAVQRERELGRRFADPYDAAAHAARYAYTPRADYYDIHGDYSVVPGHGIIGRRQTQMGGFGVQAPMSHQLGPGQASTARQRVALAESGSRSPGLSQQWDMAERGHRTSGRMSLTTTRGMSQYVYKDRPVLQLMSPGGDTLVEVIAGAAQGGVEARRIFVVGGGWTASLVLTDWDVVRVRISGQDAAASLHFSWVAGTGNIGDMRLYQGARFVSGVPFATPDGAEFLFVDTADPAAVWNQTQGNDVQPAIGLTVALTANIEERVLGTVITPSVGNDIVWVLRPF